MKYQAIIFDLFGTLVDNFGGNYVATLRDEGVLADLAGDRGEDFDHLWGGDEAYKLRMLGTLKSPSEYVLWVCQKLGRQPSAAAVQRAADIRMRCAGSLTPRADVIGALKTLKAAGLKLGLMSECTCELATLWPTVSFAPFFDAVAMSCQEGMTKPDPRFYARMLDRLGVGPGQCLYVGDGGGSELTGAVAVGMDAVLICAPHEREYLLKRSEVRNWKGPQIAMLSELLTLPDIAGQ